MPRVALLAGAIAMGVWLNQEVAAYLASLQALAKDHPMEARAALARVFRWIAIGLFGGIALLGVHLLATCRRALRIAQFPPPGAWGFGAARTWQAEPARRIARFMGVVSLALVLASTAGASVAWHIASVLLACRAP